MSATRIRHSLVKESVEAPAKWLRKNNSGKHLTLPKYFNTTQLVPGFTQGRGSTKSQSEKKACNRDQGKCESETDGKGYGTRNSSEKLSVGYASRQKHIRTPAKGGTGLLSAQSPGGTSGRLSASQRRLNARVPQLQLQFCLKAAAKNEESGEQNTQPQCELSLRRSVLSSQPLGTPRKWALSGGGDSNLVSYKLRYYQAKVAQLNNTITQKDSELARLHCVVAALRQECSRYKQLFTAGDSGKYVHGRRGSGPSLPYATDRGSRSKIFWRAPGPRVSFTTVRKRVLSAGSIGPQACRVKDLLSPREGRCVHKPLLETFPGTLSPRSVSGARHLVKPEPTLDAETQAPNKLDAETQDGGAPEVSSIDTNTQMPTVADPSATQLDLEKPSSYWEKVEELRTVLEMAESGQRQRQIQEQLALVKKRTEMRLHTALKVIARLSHTIEDLRRQLQSRA